MDKSQIRKKYKEKRRLLSRNDIDSLSLEIANLSLNMPIWDKTYYHLFLSIEGKKEVNTEYLLHILQGKDKSVVISRSDFKTFEMNHFLLQENTPIKISEIGIPEPTDGIVIEPSLLDVVFVPLLAFDDSGYRIGYGKGFYDRFLSKCRPDCIKVGLSFFESERQIIHENIDFPIDHCITPKKIYGFKNSNLYL
ncbi:MAG: 5-formyltetrahydrofolate cyclo-ligase [Bacteroidia bacterium]|nr:5-formyltetrahydrofolate cyclo-ligase [Bacteroidia bacterium]NNF30966.1 5-formyltetrahydrofolate cyclo-ligase [Flavobacteriaceae bacterium]MBT8274928.1 5-formyltetrahydrofolate cyclo-ligase [Bacteroidia bacterium]NNJ82611.1 5-formyltetrahydrofolate cyclo-ligase [Flavobacteriaceae bacterium]NNK53147.1 5-formyltetrahydrofolate cyclo-ligase [Flavobacteriaceae bacterium]